MCWVGAGHVSRQDTPRDTIPGYCRGGRAVGRFWVALFVVVVAAQLVRVTASTTSPRVLLRRDDVVGVRHQPRTFAAPVCSGVPVFHGIATDAA